MKKISNKPFDRLANKLFGFEAKYNNKIAELVNDAINRIENNKNDNNNEEEEEYEEVEVDDVWVMHGKAWQEYLEKHGYTYNMLNDASISDQVFALYTQFCHEWDQQPHPKRKIRYKKKMTNEEIAALEERIRREKEEAARHNFGFKD